MEETVNVVKPETKEVKVLLNQTHTHEGIVYESGETVMMDVSSAKFVEDAKVGKRV